MPGFFHNLGKQFGPTWRKVNWGVQALTGTEADELRAEEAVGRDLAAEIRKSLRPGQRQVPAEFQAEVDEIGQLLKARVKDKRRSYSFEVVDSGPPNAFALPGGYIFVEASLLALIGRHRDATAFVLGHEMAHVIGQDAKARIFSDQLIAGVGRRLPVAGWLAQFGTRRLMAAYSQDREFEADRLGARLMLAAGFPLEGAIYLFERLGTLSADDPELPLAPYFASHPPLAERIARLKRLAAKPALPSGSGGAGG